MRDEKEERKKQARSNKQTRQSNTAHPNVHVSMYSCALVHSTVEHFVVADVHVHVRRKITYRNVFQSNAISRFAGDLDYLQYRPDTRYKAFAFRTR